MPSSFCADNNAWAYPYIAFIRDEKGDRYEIEAFTEENSGNNQEVDIPLSPVGNSAEKTWSITKSGLGDGTHIFKIIATDKAGNSSVITRNIIIGLLIMYLTLALSVTLFPIPFQEMYDSGYTHNFIPFKSIVSGKLSPEEKKTLSAFLEKEIGIQKEMQIWK